MRRRKLIVSLFVLFLLVPSTVSLAGNLQVKGTGYGVTVQKTSGKIPQNIHMGKNLSPVGYVLRFKEKKQKEGKINLDTSEPGKQKLGMSPKI
jgi:hypothetical protein